MKKKIISFLAVLSLAFTGCQKYLEVEPANRRALESVNDIRVVLAGYLKVMKPGESVNHHESLGDVTFFTPNSWSYFEFSSDNIDFQQDYATYLDAMPNDKMEARLILKNEFSIPATIWVQHYKCIGFFNVLLDALDKATGDDTEKAQLRNEMLVCQSIYYFKLLQYFSPYKDAAMGIPVYPSVDKPFTGLAIPRSSQQDVFRLITSQLEEAMNSAVEPDLSYNIFYNKYYISNQLAQVYWYKAESGAAEGSDYANAKKYARMAVTDALIPDNKDDYLKSLNGEFSGYPAMLRWGAWSAFQQMPYGQLYGSLPFAPHASPDLLSIFDPEDIRYQTYIQPDNTIVRPQPDWPAAYNVAYTMFSPEEAYLINVESTLKDANGASETEARTLLNDFRKKRGLTTDFTGTDLQKEIVNERRREFIFRTDARWIDMKRYGIGSSLTGLEIYGKSYDVVMEPNGYQYALPVPVEEELKLNPAMTPNPGWNEILF